MNFKDLRTAAAAIREKANKGEAITAEEVKTMRQFAAANPNTDTIGAYSVERSSQQQRR